MAVAIDVIVHHGHRVSAIKGGKSREKSDVTYIAHNESLVL